MKYTYLDHNATTQILPEAMSIMLEYADMPLNPSSVHIYGRKAKSILNNTRSQIIDMLGLKSMAREYNVTFTSSGTEANAIIVRNFANGCVITSSVEHSSVITECQQGSNYFIIPVDINGSIDLEYLEKYLKNSKSDKKLISIMLANNETGIIHPIYEISELARKYGYKIHSDFIQGPGKLNLESVASCVDFITISGHKFGAPTGIAALISKADYHLKPVIFGGGQERGLRSGTENVLAIAAMGVASCFVKSNLKHNIKKMSQLRDYLEKELYDFDHNLKFVGQGVLRLPNTSMIIIPDKLAELEVIAFDLKNIGISNGAACSSGKVGSSRILKEMGYSESDSASAIRVSLGYSTTKEDIDHFLNIYKEIN